METVSRKSASLSMGTAILKILAGCARPFGKGGPGRSFSQAHPAELADLVEVLLRYCSSAAVSALGLRGLVR
jgi:hypothetical protein